ncbi:DUF3429 domain-containing protein [Aurantiacibacter spongiae]|uniref:DUF3429 domain-containing protein n=1 Tax=Aurantiacibacter spongiae TaxID=2488860 RepID=A0A3N5CZN2_9SPHN|nr:DUF3429 domain-containing protein [Aurantiacibacter spongiae]RPF72189.1 DUF3429 domain-containing protein [Aurantiacibacter spongiae]
MSRIPPWPRWLGVAGLLPQWTLLFVLAVGGDYWRFAALALAWGYAALIFSFLGGMWWGLAARGVERVDGWVWIAAVLPSLIALATYTPWVFGAEWPGPSLIVLGIAILLTPLVDRKLRPLAPDWWMSLRWPLSVGLGIATLLCGVV